MEDRREVRDTGKEERLRGRNGGKLEMGGEEGA